MLQQDFAVSAPRLFDALADQDTMGRWMGVKISVPVRGTAGLVGTVRRIHLGLFNFEETIIEAEPARRLAYRISRGVPLLAHHRGEIRVEPLAEGKARASWRVDLALRPAFVGALVRPVLRFCLVIALRRLARQLKSAA